MCLEPFEGQNGHSTTATIQNRVRSKTFQRHKTFAGLLGYFYNEVNGLRNCLLLPSLGLCLTLLLQPHFPNGFAVLSDFRRLGLIKVQLLSDLFPLEALQLGYLRLPKIMAVAA